ncbi:MAG: lipase family protein [Bdellovibrionales bacterium]|nr:lipase family protein [Bdellovibrionales bacterium]
MTNITFQTSPSLLLHPYSNKQAVLMAKCSKIVYSSKFRAKRLLEKISFTLKYFHSREPSFLIAEHDQHIVVAFKGNKEIFDLANILKFLYTEKKVKRIHNGFKTMYDKVHYIIWFHLSQLSNKPIYFTGHSRGGALAVIATAQLEEFPIAGCYTFGSPPIGIKELEHPIQNPVYGIMTHEDPLIHLKKGSNYFYTGSRYILTKDQVLNEQQNKLEKQQLKNKPVLLLKAFKAHLIQEYINRLESIETNNLSL